jgi:hypothetical protein
MLKHVDQGYQLLPHSLAVWLDGPWQEINKCLQLVYVLLSSHSKHSKIHNP